MAVAVKEREVIMATVRRIKLKSGKVMCQILFFLSGNRKTLSLGSKYTPKQVDRIKLAVDELAAAAETGGKVGKATAGFIADMTEDLRARFISAGLIEAVETVTVETLFDRFMNSEITSDLKDGTLTNYRVATRRFLRDFGANTDPATITHKDCKEWKKRLLAEPQRKNGQPYAPATVSITIQRIKPIFRWGVKQGYLETNPFEGISKGSTANPDRMFFVPMNWYYKLLDACPDQTWRTILALCRIGGLRNPSETLRLTWRDVNWANQSILVHSPKTAHHEGKESRLIPMFPELKEQLELQWELAEEGGSPYVIDRWRDTSKNMRTHFRRIIFRAGLPEWERTFQNLRESRANEIWSEYPDHIAAAWMGHSKRIAQKHYLEVTDDYFQRALQPTPAADSGANKATAKDQIEAGSSKVL
ncbi:MAG: tyrosine-type recombinase/integrase [Thermoguttaceae bacterium]|nr:tyrosine-type recombinase/integrase [Thermoguttaceae bacterium]